MSTFTARLRRVVWNTAQVIAYATLAILFSIGCGDCSDLVVTAPKARHKGASAPSAKTPRNTYLGVRAKGSTGATGRVTHDVHPPFRFDVKIGDFTDNPRPWGDGTVGISMADPAFLGQAFHSVTVARDGADLIVQFQPGGTEPPSPLRLVGADVAEVSFEHTGTEMVFRARALDAGAFQEVGRFDEDYTGPFRSSLDLGEFDKKARPGLDDPVVVFSADPPDLNTPAARAENEMARGTEQLLLALKAADAPFPDTTTAGTAMDAAVARYAQCRAELEAVGKSGKTAANKVRAVENKIAAGRRKLDQGKPDKAVAKLVAALKTLRKAFQKLP